MLEKDAVLIAEPKIKDAVEDPHGDNDGEAKKNRTATPVPRNVCQEAASEVREHCKTTY